MRAAPFFTVATLVLLTACATRSPAVRLSPVSAAALEAHVRFLASDALEGRMTGTPGYRVAAEYVEAQFRQLGLAPGAGESYLQDVPYAAALIDGAGSSARIVHKGNSRRLKWKDEFVAWADPLQERTQARAAAVFVGYGVHAPELGHDDYAGVVVKGKIVVVVNGAPKSFPANQRAYNTSLYSKQVAAASRGAVGFVLLRNAYESKQYPWERIVKNVGVVPTMHWISEAGVASDHVPELAGKVILSEEAAPALFAGAPRTYAEVMAADEAAAALPAFDLAVTLDISRRNSLNRLSSPNVVGLLKGSDPALAGEYVVYTAHLDHLGIGAPVNGDKIYNGAYDNAMGVATLIETARLLAAGPAPRRSVLFVAVGGEERGLLGSDYFARHPPIGAGRMVANINLDMPLFLYPLADVVAFGAEHSSLGPMVDAAARAEGLALTPDPTPDEVIFIRSDQYSFVRQGVPSVFLISGFGSTDPAVNGSEVVGNFRRTRYHSPSDDLSSPVDWDSARKFVRVNVGIGLTAANADAPPSWNAGNFFGDKFAPAKLR